ncbi:unnamed protein product [Phytomonas sp. EM1]|nr:unnamed protein product [Phytomonas sp. EM1]|eukprot:CCW62559.1 unnamed protein product [Phytomonas sp. isolate EM1]
MKPLVLVGALVFEVSREEGAGSAGDGESTPVASSTPSSSSSASAIPSGSRGESYGSTCGVAHPRELRVAAELQCVLHPSDSIGAITTKLCAWEGRSYERLKLELALVDVCAELSDWVTGPPKGATPRVGFTVLPQLHLASEAVVEGLQRLQRLACELCGEISDGGGADLPPTVLAALHEELRRVSEAEGEWRACDLTANGVNQPKEGDDTPLDRKHLSQLVIRCRGLSVLAAPYLRGGIHLLYGPSTRGETPTNGAPPHSKTPTLPVFRVSRHRGCCTAESIAFTAAIELVGESSPRSFLTALVAVLERVVVEGLLAERLLPKVVDLRTRITHAEFIPREFAKEDDEEASPFRYRGPIHCFPRLRNLPTARELRFWQLLYEHREYLARHAASVRTMNVFFETLPYEDEEGGGGEGGELRSFAPAAFPEGDPMDQTGNGENGKRNGGVFAGWYGPGAADTDDVVLTAAELTDGVAFRAWLEDVVEQSAMHAEARRILEEAGIGYLRRDPALPLANFLSFVKVFAAATAVRAVLERGQSADTRVVHSEAIGLSVVVGAQCDVRDGGQLLIPWYLDPNLLLALLEGGGRGLPALEGSQGDPASIAPPTDSAV